MMDIWLLLHSSSFRVHLNFNVINISFGILLLLDAAVHAKIRNEPTKIMNKIHLNCISFGFKMKWFLLRIGIAPFSATFALNSKSLWSLDLAISLAHFLSQFFEKTKQLIPIYFSHLDIKWIHKLANWI